MHRLFVGRAAFFQHGADEIDASARRIVLVAEQHIGRAGRGAEAVMHAGFQDAVGLGDLRLRELFERESGLHVRSTLKNCRHPRACVLLNDVGFGIPAIHHLGVQRKLSPFALQGSPNEPALAFWPSSFETHR